MLSRSRGHRIVAAAAVQAAAKLRDHYYGVLHNHTRRPGVEFTEILAPEGAPAWVFDREQLWNRVEAAERRKDAQLARAIEISLPLELAHAERIELLRDFIRAEFVAQGMIVDAGIRTTKLDHRNAHLLLTLRSATAAGFAAKVRQWNGKHNLLAWRVAWANRANLHLARAGHAVRIDHRTLDAQRIELTPARRTGVGRPLHGAETLPEHLQARFTEQGRIAQANGAAIIADPAIAIRALAHQRRSFTQAQLSEFLKTRTGEEQHPAALSAVMASPELIVTNPGARPAEYTSRDLIEAEKSLMRRALTLAARKGAARRSDPRPPVLRADRAASERMSTAHAPAAWPSPLREAFAYVADQGDFKAVVLPGEAEAEFLSAARAYWHLQGRRVLEGAAPQQPELLAPGDVVVVAGAEMIDLKSLERFLAAAERARATLVLLANAANLHAMGAMSPLHALLRRHALSAAPGTSRSNGLGIN
jgi:ATP-dependent exoDNAse (exonuclease V) alpha subunit